MTDEVQIADRPVPGWFFFERPGPAAAVPALAGTGAWTPCLSRKGVDSSIEEAAVALVLGARRRVLLASFRLGHPALLRALADAANRLEGGVYVISALDPTLLRKGAARLEEEELPRDKATLEKDFAALARDGVCVRGHPSCHAKFLVVDDDAALVTTANLETRAFDDTTEVGVVVRDSVEVDRLARFYTRLWYASPWQMTARRGQYEVTRRAPMPSPQRVTPAEGDRPSVLWTHVDDGVDERLVAAVVRDVATRAQRELFVASFSLLGNAADPSMLLEPVRDAIARGVSVTMFVRARNNVPEHRRDAGLFAGLGANICADDLTHAKGVFADGGAHGAIFSANFDAAHGITRGVEVGVRLDGEPALRSLAAFLAAEAEAGNRALVRDPSHRALTTLLKGPSGPLRDQLRLRAPDAMWGRLVAAVERGPCVVEYTRRSDTARLWLGDQQFTAGAEDSGARTLTEVGRGSAEERLDAWLGERRVADRGMLTATLRRAE